jgi:biotin synthase-related radical SAM superfamily protein
MVRLSVVPDSTLRLEQRGDVALILQGDEEMARGSLIEPLLHCPEQAYLTVCESCIYDCKFCAVPKMRGQSKTLQRVEEMVDSAASTGRLKAVSLTSGVEISPDHEVERVAEVAGRLRRFGVPIGVSVCPTERSNRILKNAGAVEVKYNVETVDSDLFRHVCPGLSLEGIKDALRDAIEVFGSGRVFSNVIVGLGESDRVLRAGIEELVDMGVLPVLRLIYLHPLRKGEMEMVRPSAERLLAIARFTRRVLDKHGLRGDRALTGCYRCTGCDLTPHRDL